MARLFDGTDDGLQSASAIDLSAVNKVTVAFWLWWDAFAAGDDLALEFTANYNGSTGGFIIDPNAGAEIIIGVVGDVGYNQSGWVRPSAAVWHHWVAVFDKSQASAESNLYIDGALATLNARPTTSNNTNNFANSTLNVMSRNNASLFGAGRMAELALWPGEALNASEILALARGMRPNRIRPASNPYYWPLHGLVSPEPSYRSGGPAMTVNGAVYTNHAPVRPFTRVERATFPTELLPATTINATAAGAVLTAITATMSAGAATVSATPAQAALQAVTAALSAGATTVLLTPAEATALAGIGVLQAGAVTLTTTAAQAVLSAVMATLERGGPAVQYRSRIEDVNEYGLRIES